MRGACAKAGWDIAQKANEKVTAQATTNAATMEIRENTPLPVILLYLKVDLLIIRQRNTDQGITPISRPTNDSKVIPDAYEEIFKMTALPAWSEQNQRKKIVYIAKKSALLQIF